MAIPSLAQISWEFFAPELSPTSTITVCFFIFNQSVGKALTLKRFFHPHRGGCVREWLNERAILSNNGEACGGRSLGPASNEARFRVIEVVGKCDEARSFVFFSKRCWGRIQMMRSRHRGNVETSKVQNSDFLHYFFYNIEYKV